VKRIKGVKQQHIVVIVKGKRYNIEKTIYLYSST